MVHALLDGRQTVLLRKGGIREKRFELAAEDFLLFPTVAHSHAERVRAEHRDLLGLAQPDSGRTEIVVRGAARVVAAVEVHRPENIDALSDLHIWTPGSVRADRLDFRPRHRLTVFVVAARPLASPLRVTRTPAHAGCSSWVELSLGGRKPHFLAPVHDDGSLTGVAEIVRRHVG